MDLNILWFILIAFYYTGFMLLEGFDFGVGILLPFLGKTDTERRVIINAIGPHWDGNEVWLIVAGGATFAAFPHWYATLFSGFYLAFFLLLLALIVRGVAFEFRSKLSSQRWRLFWDWAIFASSLIAPLLLGVAFANLAKGVPIDASMTYTGTFLTLLNPYGLLGGLTAISGFALIGALFLGLKTSGEVLARAQAAVWKLWIPATIFLLLLLLTTFFFTDLIDHLGILGGVIPLASLSALLLVGYFIRREKNGWAFVLMAASICLALISCFSIMFPRVMISTTDATYSLTIYTASSSPYTLKIITIVAAVFTPIVLSYQAWSYWIFRKRIKAAPIELTY
jgi:cytochrome d ubiquinol oxidase subunit II